MSSRHPAGKRQRHKPKQVYLSQPRDEVDDTVHWSFDWLDHSFDATQTNEDHSALSVLAKLRDLERLGRRRLVGNLGDPVKVYDVENLPEHVRDRLVEIGRDELDKVCRLRLSGKARLYGTLQGNVFYVLWWDPDHQVFPSRKKHT